MKSIYRIQAAAAKLCVRHHEGYSRPGDRDLMAGLQYLLYYLADGSTQKSVEIHHSELGEQLRELEIQILGLPEEQQAAYRMLSMLESRYKLYRLLTYVLCD